MFLDFVLWISGTIYRNIWWLHIRSISSKIVLTSTALICVSVLISRTCSRRDDDVSMKISRQAIPAYGRLKKMMMIKWHCSWMFDQAESVPQHRPRSGCRTNVGYVELNGVGSRGSRRCLSAPNIPIIVASLHCWSIRSARGVNLGGGGKRPPPEFGVGDANV